MTTKYTIEQKKRLVTRINNVKKQNDLKKIRDIILKCEPTLEYTKNNNGIFFTQFHLLSDCTYDEIEKFLNKMDKQKIKEITSELTGSETLDSSDQQQSAEDFKSEKKNMTKKLRLTNTENHILNRARYEKEIKRNEREVLNLSDEEFYEPEKILSLTEDNGSKSLDIFCKKTDKKKK